MCSVWSKLSARALSFLKLSVEIIIILIAEKLIELLLVRSVLTIDHTFQLPRTGFGVSVTNTLVFDTPVEFSLELVADINPDHRYSEREFLDDIRPRVAFLDLKNSDAGSIVYRGELEATHFLTACSLKAQKVDIHLGLMTRNSLVVLLVWILRLRMPTARRFRPFR